MKILLINIYSSKNAGDAVLTSSTIELLLKQFPYSEIVLAMDDPDSYHGVETVLPSLFHWIRNKNGWNWLSLVWLIPGTLIPILSKRFFGGALFIITPKHWRALLSEYLEADIVVSKPGGFLYSSGRGLSFILALYTILLALLAKKPVYILPQSIGPIRSRWECRLLKHVLNNVRLVMVRESFSWKQLQTCNINMGKVYQFPDIAFAYDGSALDTAKKLLNNLGVSHHRPLLGMTLINWGEQNRDFKYQTEYEYACEQTVRYFIEQYEGQVIFFPQVLGPLACQDDRLPPRRILEALTDLTQSVFMVEEPLPPAVLRALYGTMDIFVGTRMHSNIFALSNYTPTLAIAYQPKTIGIMRMLKMEQWCVEIETIRDIDLIGKLDALWLNRNGVSKDLKKIIPQLISQIHKIPGYIAQDYRKFLNDYQVSN